MITRRATPILAGAAIALSLAGCGGMGMGGSEQQTSQSTTGSAGTTFGAQQPTPGYQQYPQGGQSAAAADATVQSVQRQLSQRGYQAGPADGIMGENTQAALLNFQRDQGLSQTGQIDQQTLAALDTGPSMSAQQYRPQQQSVASVKPSESVRSAQQELNRRGYEAGPEDGISGPRTRQAVTAFQRDENLRADGRIGNQTMAALGMDESGQQVGEVPAATGTRQQPQTEQQSEVPQQQVPQQTETVPEADVGPREQTGELPQPTPEPAIPQAAPQDQPGGPIPRDVPATEAPLETSPGTPR